MVQIQKKNASQRNGPHDYTHGKELKRKRKSTL
jgi:hypothetical protein